MTGFAEALTHVQAGDLDKAEMTLRALPAAARNSSQAQNLLGVVLARLGQHDAAAAAFRHVLGQTPQHPHVMANLASALHEAGQDIEAAAIARQALALDPTLALAWHTLGAALNACGEAGAAEQASRAGLARIGQHPYLLNNLGNARQAQQHASDAASAYRAALALQPDYPECLVNLGTTLLTNNQFDAARPLFERALALRPGYAPAIAALWPLAPFWHVPLRGQRLELTRPTPNDATFLHRCTSDAAFRARYQRFGNNRRSPAALAGGLALGPAASVVQHRSVDWIIRRHGDATPLGLAGLADISAEHRRAEFLIGLPDSALHGSGIAVEASLLVLEFAFHRAALHKLTNLVYGDNPYAQANTQALGLQREGVRPHHLRDPVSGIWLDVYENGLMATDFSANPRLAKLSRRLLERDITQLPVEG